MSSTLTTLMSGCWGFGNCLNSWNSEILFIRWILFIKFHFLPGHGAIPEKFSGGSVGADGRIFYDMSGALLSGLEALVLVKVGGGISRCDAIDPEFGVSELVGERKGKGV